MKLKDVKPGDLVRCDGGFTCVPKDHIAQIHEDPKGRLYFECDAGSHYLTGQLDSYDNLIGLSKVDDASIQKQPNDVVSAIADLQKSQWGTFEVVLSAIKARSLEWDNAATSTPAFRAIEYGGEIGELTDNVIDVLLTSLEAHGAVGRILNIVKKIERERAGVAGSRATVEDLSKEVGDGFLTLLRLCVVFNIDPWAATKDKFNETSLKMGLKTRI